MNATETRQYEMFQRVRDFGNTHRHLFPDPGVALDTLAALGAVIADIAAADVAKRSASASARSDRKAAARKALSELVVRGSQTARVLRAGGRDLPPFDVPEPRTDQALLTTARQFVRDAAPHEAEFVAHGMVTKALTDAAAAFETAMRDRGIGRSGHLAAGTRIRELLASAFKHVRTLEVIVNNELAHDKVIQAVWKRARRVEDPRRPRSASTPEAAPVETKTEPPLPAVA